MFKTTLCSNCILSEVCGVFHDGYNSSTVEVIMLTEGHSLPTELAFGVSLLGNRLLYYISIAKLPYKRKTLSL